MERYLRFSPFYFFCLYSLLFILFTFFCNYILYDDAIFYKSFEKIIGIDSINSIIERQKIIQKINYGFIPVILFLRAFYTSFCLMIGIVISEQNLKTAYAFRSS